MFVSNKTLYQNSIQKFRKMNEEMYRLQEAISTGKNVNRPSDNPQDTEKILKQRSIIAGLDQYAKNIAFAHDWCQATNGVLETTNTMLLRCRELAQTQADGNASQEIRNIAAKEVEGLYQDLLALANTEHEGRYLFAPESMDSPPFAEETAQTLSSIENEFFMRLNIAEEREIELNTTKEVFTGGEEGQNLFATIDKLKTSLQNDDPETIREAMSEIDQLIEQVTQQSGQVGTKIKRLDRNEEILAKLRTTTETSLSQKEDADLTEKLMDYLTQNNNYSISLSTLSKVLNTNLLDLIG